jgi:mannosyltransferase
MLTANPSFFYKHELLQKYEWYWRLEPEIKYFCDITYDPFLKMIEHNKTYGFTIAVKELKETVPNIWRYASAYKRVNNITSQGLWEMFVEPEPEKQAQKEEEKPQLPEEILKGDPGRQSVGEIDPEAMEGEKYNMCHFWSNFEIARLSWFRSKEYEDFFQMMDRSGGFWMERVSFLSFTSFPLLFYLFRMIATTPWHEMWSTDKLYSGATLPSTPSPPAPS